MHKSSYSVNKLLIFLTLLTTLGCRPERNEIKIPIPDGIAPQPIPLELDQEAYTDRILGALVGSAIGDAMGASTEMWHRNDIRQKYGYVNGLTPADRTKSPEGTWKHYLMPGSTTDDTRWKYLVGEYFLQTNQLNPQSFSLFIVDYYQSTVKNFTDSEVLRDTDLFDDQLIQLDWIKEWARVALAYNESGEEYQKKLHRFYGGEMSCAGMLYGGMFGLIANHPIQAYEYAYDHALFDLGYAKDITALTSTMTWMFLHGYSIDSVIHELPHVDPYGYQDSRLVGRLATNMMVDASKISRYLPANDSLIPPPSGFTRGDTAFYHLEKIYQHLENDQKSIAFHAGEIWQILTAGLTYGEDDFLMTMQFIVNYGRDNDTVAAIAGLMLGAKLGYSGLPDSIKKEVLRVTRESIGIDLERLATRLSDHFYSIMF